MADVNLDGRQDCSPVVCFTPSGKLGKWCASPRAGCEAFLLSLRVPCVQEKLDAWDPSKADDVQYLMNMAKKYVILDTLVANGGKCTYEVLFARADEVCTHQGP